MDLALRGGLAALALFGTFFAWAAGMATAGG